MQVTYPWVELKGLDALLFLFVALKLLLISLCRARTVYTMVKSSKKSAVEVVPAPVSAPSGKKGNI